MPTWRTVAAVATLAVLVEAAGVVQERVHGYTLLNLHPLRSVEKTNRTLLVSEIYKWSISMF